MTTPTVTLQPGQSKSIELVFTQAGVVVPAPTVGGSIHIVNSGSYTAVLDADGRTVHLTAVAVGSSNVQYSLVGSTITALLTVTVIPTLADTVVFDPTTLCVAA